MGKVSLEMKWIRENNHSFKSKAPYPLPGTGDRGGEAEGCSLYHHKNSPQCLEHILQLSWKTFLQDSILQDITWMQLDCGNSHWESRGPQLWKQPQVLRVKGQPPTSAGLGSQHSLRSTRGSSATTAWRKLLCLQKASPQQLLQWNYYYQEFKSL